jgi:quinol-cytochrome oxidoreductase complex cytochrome b subunit
MLIAGILIAAGSTALTFGTESRWIGHAVTSIIGMILMVVVILTGAVQKGRIRSIRLHHVFRYHKMASTWFSLFVIGTFVLGLLTTLEHGEPLLESLHGIVGLVLVLMAIIQLVPSLLIKRRTRIQTVHRVVGYTIVPVFILQTVLGLYSAGILGRSGV